MPGWIQWRAHVPSQSSEIAAQIMLNAGCEGVQIEDVDIAPDGEDAVISTRALATITGYAGDATPQAALHENILSGFECAALDAQLESEYLDAKDWGNAWREHFPPLHIGGFWIVPSWEEPDASWP